MKKLTLLIALCLFLMSGCATARGIAQDAENLELAGDDFFLLPKDEADEGHAEQQCGQGEIRHRCIRPLVRA